ncbi:hypothetical protein [Kibdelosporangium philippinense]|uniref:hypothetical protein n=1 Tax=Kibdelosporangium philippinense TaxID=211113 RepID=UPI00361CD211
MPVNGVFHLWTTLWMSGLVCGQLPSRPQAGALSDVDDGAATPLWTTRCRRALTRTA